MRIRWRSQAAIKANICLTFGWLIAILLFQYQMKTKSPATTAATAAALVATAALFLVCQNTAIAAIAAVASAIAPLPVAADKWDADPLLWKFDSTRGTVSVVITNGNGIAVCAAAPLSDA